jgi:NADH-quinone oxidoreductase subunit L
VTQDYVTAAIAVSLGLAGIGVAWLFYGARRRVAPTLGFAQTLLEHKFYFDEVYDAVFFRPAAWVATAWNRWVEGPVIGGSLAGLAIGTRELGEGASEVQTGLLRTYALAIAAGVAVLALVFVSVR